MAIRYLITTTFGFTCTALGIWLRLKAHDLAWPLEWSYSGPREDTIWAIQEHAYQDLSLAILGFGLATILVVLIHWLRAPADSNVRQMS